ncbi:MAG: BppU family phage baseplate upper protein, partial [Oscillospiraceae bacterium]|nr:BppU family phage baseplate upper protein [Oscillospiraceae bacterium]
MVDTKCRIVLDVQDDFARVQVNVKTGDVGRKLYISLVDGGVPYIFDAGTYVSLTARKPNGNVLYDERCTVEIGDIVVYEIDGAVNELEGRVPCEVKVYGEDGSVLTSARFDMIVRDAIYKDGDEVEVPMGKTRVLLSPKEARVGEYLEIEEVDENRRVVQLKSVPAPDGAGGSGDGSCGCSITVARTGSEDDPVDLSAYGIGAGDTVRFPAGTYYVA